MTNEEIDAEIARLMPTLSPFLDEQARLDPVRSLLDGFARLLALKAYEEAARVGEEITDREVDRMGLRGGDEHLTGRQVVRAIRALKDSLVQEPVAST